MTRQAIEQREATEALQSIAGPYRVTWDSEGWSQIEAKYGAIEWHEPGSLAVYSQAMRLLRSLLAAGARHHQIGDDEYRLLFTTALLPTIAKVIRCRRRQAPRSAAHLALIRTESLTAAWTARKKRSHEVAESKLTGARVILTSQPISDTEDEPEALQS